MYTSKYTGEEIRAGKSEVKRDILVQGSRPMFVLQHVYRIGRDKVRHKVDNKHNMVGGEVEMKQKALLSLTLDEAEYRVPVEWDVG